MRFIQKHLITKDELVNKLKKRLIIIYTLNVTDVFFTWWLISTGFCYEANKLMVNIVSSPIKSVIVKMIIPGVFFYIFGRALIKGGTEKQLKRALNFSIPILLIYTGINVLHIFYSSLLILYWAVV